MEDYLLLLIFIGIVVIFGIISWIVQTILNSKKYLELKNLQFFDKFDYEWYDSNQDFGEEFDRYIDCKEVGHGSFVFEKADEDVEVKGELNTYEMEIMLKVLKSAFLIKKVRVTLGDLKNGTVMTEVQIQMALYNIVKFEILRGSNWEIKSKSRMKKGKKVMEFMVVKNRKESAVNKKKSKILVDFAGKADQKYVMLELLRWQEDEGGLEVNVYPGIRLYGNSSMSDNEIEIETGKEIIEYENAENDNARQL